MTPLLLFGSLVLVPAVLAILLRINAAVLFMSLCVGEVLVQYVASDTGSFAATFGGHTSNVSESTLRLALLLIPPILTAIFMFHSVHGGPKSLMNVCPAVGVGLLTALLVKPLLSTAFQRTLENSSLWHQFSKAQALVVSVSALFSLLFLWLQRHNSGESKHHSKRHHA
jgi:hypothetical protein